jgi:hypothetical protein
VPKQRCLEARMNMEMEMKRLNNKFEGNIFSHSKKIKTT